ncbi:MAG: flagellar hook-length control protein FliK [Devosia sp.]
MASHLTVTTAGNSGVAPKAFNASAPSDAGSSAADVFAALLGAEAEAAASKPTGVKADLVVDGLPEVPLEKPDTTPDAIAAAIDAIVPIQDASAAPALADVIDGLSALRTALQNGELPSADDMAKLTKALDALADALGVSLDSLPSVDELAAMAAKPLPEGAGIGAQLQAALAPAAQDLLGAATAKTATDPAAAEQLKALGEKLAALLQGLEADSAATAKLNALTKDSAALDADLQAALAKLAKSASVAETAASTQSFVPPKLETSEPALTGKTADASAVTADTETADPVVQTTPSDQSGDDTPDPREKPKDSKIAAPVTMQSADSTPDPRNAAQVGIHAATRIEAAVAPRAIVAGYQTSQQQLNLPQIAFELVRQVNDGNTRFQMRLDPPELGKIDVRLDIDRSGQVTARLTVEKAETLDLMQRDQRGLEKALQQAGLDSSKTNLEFSLKQNSSGQQGQGNSDRQPFFGGDLAAEVEDTPPPQINLYRASLSASGVNIIA